jgi:P-type conjugative transfer protein TrbJ
MRLINFTKHTLVGILMGLMLTPGFMSPPPAQAQWLTFDATNYALQIQKMADELNHWMATIQHYTDMYDKAVKQVTSLGGILTTVDKQLARNKDLVASIAGIGKSVRQIYQMKRQIESMVETRIRAVRSLDSRLKSGIFNPQQDLQDLEEYLRDSIGRSSQDTIANIERLANADNEFERVRYELQLAYGRLAEAEAALKQFEAMADAELAKPESERYNLGVLQSQIGTVKIQIEQIKTLINDLTEKIAAKMKLYGIRLSVRSDYGQLVHETTKAWEATVPVRQDVLKAIDDEFALDEGIDSDPVDGRFTMDPDTLDRPILRPQPSPQPTP